jgi:hypothetical protein
MLVGHGLNAKSGKPYSEERNYTIIIGLQAEFRDLVKGKANKPAAVEPALCFQGEAAKINVISESVPLPQSEPLAPFLPQDACSPETTGTANTTCTELAEELTALAKEIATLAAPPRGVASPRAKEFRLRNDTSCPICFTYRRCNDYGCWDEAVRASGKSTLFAGVGVRAPVIKNPQFCHSGGALPVVALPPSKPALAHINFPAIGAESPPPLPSRKPEQIPTGAAESRKHPVEPEAVFLAAKEKAKREGVHTLTSEDIRGLSLEQIRALRGY